VQTWSYLHTIFGYLILQSAGFYGEDEHGSRHDMSGKMQVLYMITLSYPETQHSRHSAVFYFACKWIVKYNENAQASNLKICSSYLRVKY
jgi:hypothetical protein